MKKRVLALLLAATMVFGLAACGGSDSGDTADNATVTDDAGTDDAADAEDTDAAQTDDAADTETEADTTTASTGEKILSFPPVKANRLHSDSTVPMTSPIYIL